MAYGVPGENFHWEEMQPHGSRWKAYVTPRSTRRKEFRFDIYYYDRNGRQTFLGSKYLFIKDDRNRQPNYY